MVLLEKFKPNVSFVGFNELLGVFIQIKGLVLGSLPSSLPESYFLNLHLIETIPSHDVSAK